MTATNLGPAGARAWLWLMLGDVVGGALASIGSVSHRPAPVPALAPVRMLAADCLIWPICRSLALAERRRAA